MTVAPPPPASMNGATSPVSPHGCTPETRNQYLLMFSPVLSATILSILEGLPLSPLFSQARAIPTLCIPQHKSCPAPPPACLKVAVPRGPPSPAAWHTSARAGASPEHTSH